MVQLWTLLDENMSTKVGNASDEFSDWHKIAEQITENILQAAPGNQPTVIGVAGSQGSGKSTLAAIIVGHLQRHGFAAEAVSLDDFYVTKAERVALAASVHPLMRTRGVPGTHDTHWLQRVLRALKDRAQGQEAILQLPKFDKASDDRLGQRDCRCQILVLEGWCLGVQAQPQQALELPVNELERQEDAQGIWRTWVNEQTAANYEPLWPYIQYWVQLRPPSFAQVIEWRSQQEQQISPQQRMNPQALQRFIDHYERLTEWQWQCAPLSPGIAVHLSADHRVEAIVELSRD